MAEFPNWIDVNDVVRGPITRITDSGDRHIEFADRDAYLNLGKHMTADIGDVVEARVLNSRSEGNDLQGRCLIDDVISGDSFRPNDGQKWGTTKKEIPTHVANLFGRSGGPNNYAHFCMEIKRISNNGYPVADAPGFSEKVLLRENLDELTTGSLALVKINRTELTSLPQGEFIKTIPQEEIRTLDLTKTSSDFAPVRSTTTETAPESVETDVDNTPTTDNPSEGVDSGITEKNEKSVQFTSSNKKDRTQSKSTGESQSGSTNLSDLRRRAEEAAVQEVSEESADGNRSLPYYTRSQPIKDYIKARADGICEGCDKPAPFTNKKGEPYLHAHHVHELSKGGSDTPDTVIALCPNCHYQVHHGEDGEEYNRELEKKLKKIEN